MKGCVAVPSDAAMRFLQEISHQVQSKVSIDFIQSQAPEVRAYANELKNAGYLERCDEYFHNDSGSVIRIGSAYRSLRVSDAGWAALAARQDLIDRQRQQHAYEASKAAADHAYADEQAKKQFRHDWRISAFEVFGGFILGAIADNRFDIVGKAARLLALLFANG